MKWLLLSPDQMLKKCEVSLNNVIKDLRKEGECMKEQERKIIADIKRVAKSGDIDVIKSMVKDLIRTRSLKSKFYEMGSDLGGLLSQVETAKVPRLRFLMMKIAARFIQAQNRKLNAPQLQKILHDFHKEFDHHLVDDYMLNESSEAEKEEDISDKDLSRVLDELGVQIKDQLSTLPEELMSLDEPQIFKAADVEKSASMNNDLESRLENPQCK